MPSDIGKSRFRANFVAGVQRLRPEWVAFVGSLLLSWIAVTSAATVGRDAALYLDVANIFVHNGFGAAFHRFNWPWLSIFIGSLHLVTGLSLEASAYLICAMLMAGACAVLVRFMTLQFSGTGYWACLVVLATPAFNDYRGQILREFGFWCFSVWALALAIRWQRQGGWGSAALVYGAILAAALFRLEALYFIAVLALWQLCELRNGQSLWRVGQLAVFPLVGGLIVAVVMWIYGTIPMSRVDYYLALVDPGRVLGSFNALANDFAGLLRQKYSRDDAAQILFFGITATLFINFLTSLGLFLIPVAFRYGGRAWRPVWQNAQPFAWAWLLYFVGLMVFFWHEHFVVGRYASFLSLLAVPLVSLALARFGQAYPRLGKAMIVIGLLMMLANVVSLSPKKHHYVDAGVWIEQHVAPEARIYYEDRRISYYAGRAMPSANYHAQMALTEAAVHFDYFVLHSDLQDPVLDQAIGQEGLRVLATFSNSAGDTVSVLGR